MAPKKTAVKKTAAKRPVAKVPARSTPKVSPLRGMPVAAWIEAKASSTQRPTITKLLALVRRLVPAASVSIKWGQPVVEHHGPMVFIKVARAHVTFGFWRGAELSDAAGVLEGGATMKHVKLASADDLDEQVLGALVQEAAALNETQGDPTRRGGARP